MPASITLNEIELLDKNDPLADFRSEFVLEDGLVYLDGNSLGPAPKAVFEKIETVMREEWAGGLIRSWNDADWFKLTDILGDRLAACLGAVKGELVVTDSTSINIFKALHAAAGLRPERNVIVAEGAGFPTDLYMLEGALSTLPGYSARLEGVDGDHLVDLIDQSVAVVLVNHVDYKTGRLRDMAAITARAHEKGALVIWDLCHTAGVVPVDLNGSRADFAIGCSYKYLNGGPGAPAFIYVAKQHQAAAKQPLSGWWGHANPFAMQREYQPDASIRKFLCGTQSVLALQAMDVGLEIFERADKHAMRQKSMQLTDLFVALVKEHCGDYGLKLISPEDAAERGSQISFSCEHGYEIMQALIERNVIGDFRAPDILRFGFAPLYVRYADVRDAVFILKDILDTNFWKEPRFSKRSAVT